jgi:hypothetical protein
MTTDEDPWVTCLLKAKDATEEFLSANEKSIVRRLPNGDVMLQFRQSELRKLPE